jgi:hypothetical protein
VFSNPNSRAVERRIGRGPPGQALRGRCQRLLAEAPLLCGILRLLAACLTLQYLQNSAGAHLNQP